MYQAAVEGMTYQQGSTREFSVSKNGKLVKWQPTSLADGLLSRLPNEVLRTVFM
jgi:hypothetical protein